ARSKTVTTLIAEMSDFLAPISKSTTRTYPTYTNGSVRGISLMWRCRNNGKAQLSSAPRPNFRRGFGSQRDLFPPRSNPGINHRKPKIYFIFQYDMAERVGFEPTVRFPAHTLSKRAP